MPWGVKLCDIYLDRTPAKSNSVTVAASNFRWAENISTVDQDVVFYRNEIVD